MRTTETNLEVLSTGQKIKYWGWVLIALFCTVCFFVATAKYRSFTERPSAVKTGNELADYIGMIDFPSWLTRAADIGDGLIWLYGMVNLSSIITIVLTGVVVYGSVEILRSSKRRP